MNDSVRSMINDSYIRTELIKYAYKRETINNGSVCVFIQQHLLTMYKIRPILFNLFI